MSRPLLNIDLGELADEPEALYTLAHVANIACGGHAGDPDSVRLALSYCARHGTRVGAHPSYPDRPSFGRRSMAISPAELRDSVAAQCDLIADLAAELKLRVEFVKPHGALYHDAHGDAAVARAVVSGAVESLGYEVALIGPPGGELEHAARDAGLSLLSEAFADRGLRPDGSLIPRGEPGALIRDAHAAAAQTARMIGERATATVCVHGDSPDAVAIARAVREYIDTLPRDS